MPDMLFQSTEDRFANGGPSTRYAVHSDTVAELRYLSTGDVFVYYYDGDCDVFAPYNTL